MRTAWTALVAVSAMLACSRPGGHVAVQPAATEAPALPVPLLPPDVDLSGTWATGTGTAPGAATITLHVECTHHPAVWLIRQTGNTIEAWAFAESFDQGIVVKGAGVAKPSASPGWISGLDITIDDDRYKYRLRYDPATQHLAGTRNDSAFWAARQTVVRTQGCPGVP